MKKPILFLLVALVVAGGTYIGWCLRVSAKPAPTAAHQAKYQCSMHPQIVRDEPGDCPICHMHLQLMDNDSTDLPATAAVEHKIIKYRHPMNPKVFADKPMKDEMGMDYIPVYADELGDSAATEVVKDHAAFTLNQQRRQLIGVRSEAAEVRQVLRTLRLPGRVGEDNGTVLAQALEMDGSLVKPGLEAQAWVAGEGARRARVVSVDRSLDAFSRTFGVRLALLEPAGPGYRPGVYVDVRVQMKLAQGITVPKEAVLDTGDRQLVFVQQEGGRFEPRNVQVGKQGDDFTEIRKGVAAGERVVTSANFLIDSESRFQAAARDFGGKP